MVAISNSDLTGMDFAVVDEDLGKMHGIYGEMNQHIEELKTDADSTRQIWDADSIDQFEAKMKQLNNGLGLFHEDWDKITKFVEDVKQKYMEVNQRAKKRFE